MAREFDRNMFVMLVAIMIGVVVVTYFIADIVRRSEIETLTTEHSIEIEGINSKNENFTNSYLQGSVTMDSAREVREAGNLDFVIALFWYNNALVNASVWFNDAWTNGTKNLTQQCINNCTTAMEKYLSSYQKFADSKPYFEKAMTFTEQERYIMALGYYVNFAQLGQNITVLRYNASRYLKQAAENLSIGNTENATMLMENFTVLGELYEELLEEYEEQKGQIDDYLFFDEIREEY